MKFLAVFLVLTTMMAFADKRDEACEAEFKSNKTLQGEYLKKLEQSLKFKIKSNLIFRGILPKKNTLDLKLKISNLNSLYGASLNYSATVETRDGKTLTIGDDKSYLSTYADDLKLDRYGVVKPGQNTITCRTSAIVYNAAMRNQENNFKLFDIDSRKELKFVIPTI